MIIDTVIIDEKEYYVVDKVKYNNQIYYYLVSLTDNKDILIRKYILRDGKEYLIGLENEEEFNKVLESYIRENSKKETKEKN